LNPLTTHANPYTPHAKSFLKDQNEGQKMNLLYLRFWIG